MEPRGDKCSFCTKKSQMLLIILTTFVLPLNPTSLVDPPSLGRGILGCYYGRSLTMCNFQPLLVAVDYTLMQLSKITYLHIIGQWRIIPIMNSTFLFVQGS